MVDDDRVKQRTSRVATVSLLVSLGLVLGCLGAALFFLPLMGLIGIAIVAGGALFSIALALHYVLWGWWLPRLVDDEQTDDDA